MPLPDDLLHPISGSDNPSGSNFRFDPIYDRLKEARREESQPPVGMSAQDRKVADNPLVIKLATKALLEDTKDLQIAAWLTEALLKQNGIKGLRQGLATYYGLLDKYWDTIYPAMDEGDPQDRLASLNFLESKLDIPLKLAPIVEQASYSFLDYRESREVGYEADAKSDEAKKKRVALLKENKLDPEVFDKTFAATPKAFYKDLEKDLDASLQTIKDLKEFCSSRFEDGPSFNSFLTTIVEVRHLIHNLLQKKLETEPDEVVEEVHVEEPVGGQSTDTPLDQPPRTGILISIESSGEPAYRQEAVRKVVEAAAFLRQREPLSPAPYLMLRGLRWGELRVAVRNEDPGQFDAPPTELRRHLKRLYLAERWADLLDTSESAMALPCSRAWLDLQRYIVEACEALGAKYELIASSIRSALNTLLDEIPELLDATLSDDTPAANAGTRGWLKTIAQTISGSPNAFEDGPGNGASGDENAVRWPRRTKDARFIANEAVQSGDLRTALEVMQLEINRQRSGRERFNRKMQLVEICIATGNPAIAQPFLEDLSLMIENHKLDEWEEPRLVAEALGTIMKSSARIQADKGQQQKLFERICRLNPAKALGDA